ncbi:MAG: tyrosine-type recombinase/integrase [Anaerovoracaceae bacterium]
MQIRKAEKRLGWQHRFSCHTLRHAYATHLYEQGTDLLTIKHLMVHKSIHSTTIYISLARALPKPAVSPFDRGGDFHG